MYLEKKEGAAAFQDSIADSHLILMWTLFLFIFP